MARGKNKTTEDFKDEVRELVGSEYVVEGDYERYDIPIEILHKGCGTVQSYRPATFLKNPKCLFCFPRRSGTIARKSKRIVQEEIDRISKGTFKIIGEYRSRTTPVAVEHTVCGEIFMWYPNAVDDGSLKCGTCSGTSGEQAIEGILIRSGVAYDTQYSIKESGSMRRYDFHLPQYKALIEFDGSQHFNSIEHWGGEESLAEINKVDEEKTNIALDNGFKILRIKYTEYYNLDEIIVKFIRRMEEVSDNGK